jgi:flagellar biosynthesis GTPase FlhF
MIGRGTRPKDGTVDGWDAAEDRREAIANSGKTHCLVLDFVGNSGKFRLVSAVDILAGDDIPSDDVQRAKELIEEDGEQDIEEALDKARQEREDREEAERKQAARRAEQQRLKEEAERKQAARRAEQQRLKEEAERKARLVADAQYKAVDADPFGNTPVPEIAKQPFEARASQKQIDFLVGCYGVSENKARTLGRKQASAIIDHYKRQTGSKYILTFGKYKSKRLEQIPDSYLRWARENLSNDTVVQNIKLHFEKGGE